MTRALAASMVWAGVGEWEKEKSRYGTKIETSLGVENDKRGGQQD